MGRHLEGLHHMLLVSPTVEVGAFDYGPVSVEPRPHQRVAADHLQVCNVLWPEKFVVSQLARNEDAILLDRLTRPRILIRELSDFPSARIGVDVARLDPLVSGPAGVACCPKPAAYTLARAQRCRLVGLIVIREMSRCRLSRYCKAEHTDRKTSK